MVAENKATETNKVEEKPVNVIKEDKKGSPETADKQTKLKSINLKLPEDVHCQLKSKVALEGESTAKVVRRLIDEYLKAV